MNTLVAKHDQLLQRIENEFDDLSLKLIEKLTEESDYSPEHLRACDTEQLIKLGEGSLHIVTRDMAKRVEKLDAALCADKIGMYGTCTDCEEAIAIYDLEIDPAEPRCFECRQRKLSQ
ncbi:TraR/DksA C4-type zinc finger protein [Thaumasiovibrio subtropicus]|uniref:TraR/DksA C4-type zinc finger protein n=1 Tax=Thaumasiovibrio subtropicus TaxID=1891207 RepID=UPI000B3599D8|nr:TraR/DksA C4-type zinc finger protein [Thaumasiovibrio subtropicus]